MSLEADVYTSDLLTWLSSDLSRISYCDEALKEFGLKGIGEAIAVGQVLEKQEVYDAVLAFLKEMEEEDEAEDPEVAPRKVETVPGEDFEDTDPMEDNE